MNKTQNIYRYLLLFGVPVLLLLTLFFVTKNNLLDTQSESMSLIITLDLLITIPFVYFLLIRKTRIPKTTIIPLMIIGLIMGSFILPSDNQTYLNLFKVWILPIIELSVAAYIILKIRKTRAHFENHKTAQADFFTTLKMTTKEVMPKVTASVFSMEIAVIYYGFIDWKKRILKENEFTYHKNNGTTSLLIALIFLILIETTVLHILIEKWSPIAAWVLTGISIYSGIQIFGFLKSILKRPISIENDVIYLRYGIIKEATIALKNIDSVEYTTKTIEFDKSTKSLSMLGSMEGHNVIIHLKDGCYLNGLYGIRSEFKSIAFNIDNREEFKKQLEEKLS